MTECVILLRLQDGAITAVGADRMDSQLLVFKDRYEAIAFALRQPFAKDGPYQIVELDELERDQRGPAKS